MINTILLDLDGVCANFVKATLNIFGRDYPNPWPKNTYSVAEVIGVTESRMWEKIDNEGTAFWEHLEPYEYAQDLYRELKAIAPTFFCTSPCQNPYSLAGKLAWMQRFTGVGKSFRYYAITPHKYLLAKQGVVLIDDYEVNTKRFSESGGHSILFPQDWNSGFHNHPYNDKLTWVLEQVEGLFE